MLAAVAAIIVFILVAPVRVHGDGIAPVLHDGDIVIIAKNTYSAGREPERGEIVAFYGSEPRRTEFARFKGSSGDPDLGDIRGKVVFRIWPIDRFGTVK
jgi:signal peptidase I